MLPQILKIMKDFTKESYLKDKGSSYRYTQAYKLQLIILQQLAPLIINLEMTDKQIELTLETLEPYLSKKQPLPLQVQKKTFTLKNHLTHRFFFQEAAVQFFKTIALYDVQLPKTYLQNQSKSTNYSDTKMNSELLLQYFEGIENETK